MNCVLEVRTGGFELLILMLYTSSSSSSLLVDWRGCTVLPLSLRFFPLRLIEPRTLPAVIRRRSTWLGLKTTLARSVCTAASNSSSTAHRFRILLNFGHVARSPQRHV